MDPDSRTGPAAAGFPSARSPFGAEIIVADPRWRRLVPRAERVVARAARLAGVAETGTVGEPGAGHGPPGGAAATGCSGTPDSVRDGTPDSVRAVLLTSDREAKRLNARHRGRNKPTNVLTFETGDLVLAYGTVRREARAAGKRPSHHLAHLVVHGALHLRGHDHEHPGDARRMEMAESRLLHRLRVPNPWRHA